MGKNFLKRESPTLRLEHSVFLKHFEKKIFFFRYSYSFLNYLFKEYLVVSKFLLEVPKFKENILICIITDIKVRDLFPADTGRKLNVHRTFRRRPRRLLNVLCKFNLRPVSTGLLTVLQTMKMLAA